MVLPLFLSNVRSARDSIDDKQLTSEGGIMLLKNKRNLASLFKAVS